MTPSSNAGRLSRRIMLHHIPLGVTSGAALAAIYLGLDEGSWTYRSSMATAYVGIALLAVTMLLGSAFQLIARTQPLSSDLRRDFGIWTGMICLAHVLTGLQVHFGGQFYKYFLKRAEESGAVILRTDFVGWANHAGLAAGGFFVVLLVISNDASLRRLGAKRWKRLQMLSYGALALSVIHGLIYQIRAEQAWSLRGFLIGSIVLVVWAKAAAWFQRRR